MTTQIDYSVEPAVMCCDGCGCVPYDAVYRLQTPSVPLATFYRMDDGVILCEKCIEPAELPKGGEE